MPHVRVHLLVRIAAGVMLLLGASVGAQEVKIHTGLAATPVPPVVVTAPPPLVAVPGTSVAYAPEAPANLFVYQGRYYTPANHVWSTALPIRGRGS